jgi:hypothetical protein
VHLARSFSISFDTDEGERREITSLGLFLPNYYSVIYFLIALLELIVGGLDKGKKIQLTYDSFLESSDM